MKPTRRHRPRLLLLAPLLVGACATRPLHPTFPSASPASMDATSANLAGAPVSLATDPPLPGEPIGAWASLEPRTASGASAPAEALRDAN